MRSKIIDIIITAPFMNRLHSAYHKDHVLRGARAAPRLRAR